VLRRYWPVVAVVVVLAGLLVVVPALRGDDDPDSTTASAGRGDEDEGDAEQEAALAAPDCDRETGRIKIPSVYAPQCVPVWDGGDNGGATSPGVTADEVVVAVYEAQTNEQAAAANESAGLGDQTEQSEDDRNRDKVVAAFQAHFETYGRTVRWVKLAASGPADDDAAAKADALKAASELGAFAVIGGPTGTNAFVEELVARKIICLCTVSQPIENYHRWAPYVWSQGLASTEAYFHLTEFVGKRLGGRPARWAGGDLQGKDRSFALVYYETADNAYKAGSDYIEKELRDRYDVTLTERLSYLLDFSKAQEDARLMIAKLKAAGVTTIVFSGDPYMPAYLTQEATKASYFPEWVPVGPGVSTASFGRTYDQEQWKRAFTVSYGTVRLDQAVTQGEANVVSWHHGEELTSYPGLVPWNWFFTALHLAGPDLTPETFRDGLFRYKPVKGYLTYVAVSFGKGTWPFDDYSDSDDATELWYDPTAPDKDRDGKDVVGAWRYVDGGKRYMPGEWPDAEPKAFDPAGTVLTLSERPAADRPPAYSITEVGSPRLPKAAGA
jgi:hypothetical protein